MNEATFVKYFETASAIKAEIGKAVLGKNEVIEKILTAVFAGGHILLDDIPGVGKTTMALAFSKATGMEYKRLPAFRFTIKRTIRLYINRALQFATCFWRTR